MMIEGDNSFRKQQNISLNRKTKLVVFLLFISLTTLLVFFLSNKNREINQISEKPLEILQVAPASVSNVTLSLSSSKTSLKSGESATISLKSTSVPAGYKFLGFIVAIKVPKTLTPSFNPTFATSFPLAYDFTYPTDVASYSDAIKDKGTYYEVQALGAKRSSAPIALSNTSTLFTFQVTPVNTTKATVSIESITDTGGNYPSVVSSDLTEAKLANIAPLSISLNPIANQAALRITSTSGTAGTGLTLTTSGGSGTGTVRYATTTSGCTVVTNRLTRATAGTCSVVATKVADANYNTISSSATTVTFSKANQATPTIGPSASSFAGTVTITASTTTSGATLRYTDNGSAVTSSSAVFPSTGVVVTATTANVTKTIKVKGFLANYNDSAEASKTITVTVSNQAPTNITLSNTSVAENLAVATTVGTLSTTDPDSGNTFTYTMTGTDAGKFTLTGNTIKTNAIFDYETKNSYSVKIKSTDQGGLFKEVTFTISVTDVVEYASGDVNGDTRVNTADIIFMVEALFGDRTPTAAEQARMELNNDGRINSLDIIVLVKLLFS